MKKISKIMFFYNDPSLVQCGHGIKKVEFQCFSRFSRPNFTIFQVKNELKRGISGGEKQEGMKNKADLDGMREYCFCYLAFRIKIF